MMKLPMDCSVPHRFPPGLGANIKNWLLDKKIRRDPIHDEIELNALERVIIDTPDQ